MAPARASGFAPLTLAVGAAVVGLVLSAVRIGHGAPDFYVFWTAARHWNAPYDPAIITALERSIHLSGTWPFVYPPSFLVFVWPFTLAPMTWAYPLWTALSVGLYFRAAAEYVRPVWATALLALAPVVFFSAELGQTSLLVGAALLGGWRLRDARPWIAGALFGLAAAIKPQAMILAPVILWGRWRMLAAMALSGLAVAGASLAFGWERWIEWPRAVAAFGTVAPGADRANPSALIPGPLWTAAIAALGLALALARRDLMGLVGGAFCLTPYAHAYDLAPIAPVAAAWLIDPRRHGWDRAAAGGALLAGLVSGPATVLAFFAAVAVFDRPWWPLRRGAELRAVGVEAAG